MGKINLLSSEVANLIAAGEVVDRPASVLKELLENAIDSGATDITAEIKRGGVSLMRVSDNGCGISPEDLPLSIKRHATSKIACADDLDAIETLGFRGEALAAIAAVSQMRIITKTREAEFGTMLSADCGNIVDVSDVGCADGTTVVVEELFEKFPARRKFLKKDATESMAVAALVEKVALSHPEIAFHLIIDGESKFKTSGGGKLLDAVYAVLGRDFAKKLIAVDGGTAGISVSGYVGRSDNVRGNRNHQNVFLNGRYVKSKTVMAALERAYTSYIAPERFPVCVLFLEVNPRTVDVNVHPAKLEVKFSDERAIFESVYYAVRGALEANASRPELELNAPIKKHNDPLRTFLPVGEREKVEQISFGNTPTKSSSFSGIYEKRHTEAPQRETFAPYAPSSQAAKPAPSAPVTPRATPRESIDILEKMAEYKTAPVLAQAPYSNTVSGTLRAEAKLSYESAPEPKNVSAPIPDGTFRLVGEAFNCYVIIERGGELLVIDKHAAHERIIFEELKARQSADGRVGSQSLIVPIHTTLSAAEASAASEYKSDLTSIGFEYELDDERVMVTAIPDAISIGDAEALFIRMTGELAAGIGRPDVTEQMRRERALYQVACKAAIKGGRHYGEDEILWLCQKVVALPDITVCPHGRPIAFILKKSELDRRFERI